MQMSYSSWSAIRGGHATLSDVLELLEQKIRNNRADSNQTLLFKKKVSIEKLNFKYNKSKTFSLKDINLEIEKRSIIGFIGETGSGKSTFLDVFMGLLQPSQGIIKVDDIELSDQNISKWRQMISHVPQEIFLADTSILENIAFGVPRDEIDIDKVKISSERALISEMIESLELQYDTTTGERGISLSGGQKQRLGIARALYKNSSIIVLDEATSALDIETEEKVIESIRSLDNSRTILMVAHRLQTLKFCDRIVKLKNGEIISEGSYDKILGDID